MESELTELRNWIVEITGEVIKQYPTVARSMEEAEEQAEQEFLEEFDFPHSNVDVDIVSVVAVADDESTEVEDD